MNSSARNKIASFINRANNSNSLIEISELSNELRLFVSDPEQIKDLTDEDKKNLYFLREKILGEFFNFANS